MLSKEAFAVNDLFGSEPIHSSSRSQENKKVPGNGVLHEGWGLWITGCSVLGEGRQSRTSYSGVSGQQIRGGGLLAELLGGALLVVTKPMTLPPWTQSLPRRSSRRKGLIRGLLVVGWFWYLNPWDCGPCGSEP